MSVLSRGKSLSFRVGVFSLSFVLPMTLFFSPTRKLKCHNGKIFLPCYERARFNELRNDQRNADSNSTPKGENWLANWLFRFSNIPSNLQRKRIAASLPVFGFCLLSVSCQLMT